MGECLCLWLFIGSCWHASVDMGGPLAKVVSGFLVSLVRITLSATTGWQSQVNSENMCSVFRYFHSSTVNM